MRHGVEILSSALTALTVVGLFRVLPFPRIALLPVGEAVLAERTQYSLDTATIENQTITLQWNPQPRLALYRSQAVSFNGWAIDAAAALPAASVKAVIDGATAVRANVGSERPDVAAKFARSAVAASGFRLVLPTCSLRLGPHRIAFRFETVDGRGYYRANDDVDLIVVPAPPRARYAVDAVAPSVSHPGEHTMHGWFVDAANCAAVHAVTVTLDGRAIALATYGLARRDVAASLGVPGYKESGFRAHWNDVTLAHGQHVLRLVATTSEARRVDAGYELRFMR